MRATVLVLFFASLSFAQESPHGRLSMSCDVCHSTSAWTMRKDAKFKHDSTGFPLEGKHGLIACRDCHAGLTFSVPVQASMCSACHDDIHKGELGSDCRRCHNMDSWIIKDMLQKHQQTRFPLVGMHQQAVCEECHERNEPRRYAGTPTGCISCHKSEYASATNPDHVHSGFSVDCSTCHAVTAASWTGSFDHQKTAFPLTGAHRAILCSQCHLNNRFTQLPTDCFSCHSGDFQSTTSPAHVTGNFSHNCVSCHTTSAWSPATFDHNQTGFPLSGRHTQIMCQDCHVNGNYSLTYNSCYQCHQNDFQQASNPSHSTNAFSHDCQSCHTTSGWSPATFDHSQTRFTLTGAHVAAACISCHVNGDYRISYTDCYQCHQTDYARPTNPSHTTANFDHDCTPCHSTTAWIPSTMNHDGNYFKIYSGAHAGRWTLCTECHTVPTNFSLFSCIDCHTHNQTDTDSDHRGVTGYTYASTACYNCHRNR